MPGIALDQPDAGQQENLPDCLRNDGIGDELAEAFVRPEARMQIGCAAADAKFVRLGEGTGIEHGRADADCNNRPGRNRGLVRAARREHRPFGGDAGDEGGHRVEPQRFPDDRVECCAIRRSSRFDRAHGDVVTQQDLLGGVDDSLRRRFNRTDQQATDVAHHLLGIEARETARGHSQQTRNAVLALRVAPRLTFDKKRTDPRPHLGAGRVAGVKQRAVVCRVVEHIGLRRPRPAQHVLIVRPRETEALLHDAQRHEPGDGLHHVNRGRRHGGERFGRGDCRQRTDCRHVLPTEQRAHH